VPVDRLRRRDAVVQSLSICLVDGGFALAKVPGLVKRLLKEDGWRERIVVRTGQRVTFTSFEDFVSAKPLEGLGSTISQVRNCCRDDPKALDAIDCVVQRTHGGSRNGSFKFNNVKLEKPPMGNSAAAALRRLRDARPDLHRQVLAKKKTAHAAMIEAGFRHRTATVPVDDLDALINALARTLGARRWRVFTRKLTRVNMDTRT